MAEEKTHNEAGEQAPSTVEQQAPDVAEENAPATSEPTSTEIPSANMPEPETVNSGANPDAVLEKKPKQAVAEKTAEDRATGEEKDAEITKEPKAARAAKGEAEGAEAGEKPKAAKKEKAPALEDKPFADFIQQDYLPALKQGLAKQGAQDATLTFVKQKIAIVGYSQAPECWQIEGRWNTAWRQSRQFNIYFFKEDIQGQRAFSYAESGGRPSTLEPFLIDERKINLDLLIYGTMQRLNAQKWLVRN